jgi:hypothetical protein
MRGDGRPSRGGGSWLALAMDGLAELPPYLPGDRPQRLLLNGPIQSIRDGSGGPKPPRQARGEGGEGQEGPRMNLAKPAFSDAQVVAP